MTYTEAKNEIAGKYDFDTWEQMDKAMSLPENLFHPLNDYERWQELHGEASKLYASEKVKEALKVAAERAEVIYHCGKTKNETNHKYIAIGHNHIRPNRGMILSLETELLKSINNE